MHRFSKIIFIGTIITAFSGAAEAAFVNNYSTWRKFSHAEKMAYVAGFVDSATVISEDSQADAAYGYGTLACFSTLGLMNDMVADAITKYYADHTKDWDKAPSYAYAKAIVFGPCLKFINEERRKRGLENWKEAQEGAN